MDYDAALTAYRGFNFALGILENQCGDPLCKECRAFSKTLDALANDLDRFEKEISATKWGRLVGFDGFKTDVREKLSRIKAPENPLSQKKLGKCKLVDVCFTKTGPAVLTKIMGP
jgi:hypothetical protein